MTFENLHDKISRVGVHLPNENAVVDLSAAFVKSDMRGFLEAGESALSEARKVVSSGLHRVPQTDVKFKAPISNPEKVVCVGLNYADHAKESGMALPAEPVLFSKFASAIIGPNESIVKPPETQKLDYEVELVIVIGKEGRRIPRSEAMKHVAGFTVGHDVSARDWQLEKGGGQWMIGKTFDTFAPIGPAIVTPDALSNVHNLGIRLFINDKPMQNSNTDQMIFRTEELIEYISKVFTLKPGDLIFTGTPPGVGFGRKPPVFLQPGDVVKCQIDELGELVNNIV